MRTSGGSGHDSWMIVFPLIGLLLAASLANGGVDGLLNGVDGAVRQIVVSMVGFLSDVF